jgi:hypothetical protein
MQKVSRKGCSGNHSGQTPRGSGPPPHSFVVADFVMLFGGVVESFFKVKKLPSGIKDLKIIKSGDPKPKKPTVATEKHVAAAIPQNR